MSFPIEEIEKLRGKGPLTAESLKKALWFMHGNATHAAVLLDITKVHMVRLIKKFRLRQYANEQRRSIGVSSTGRPSLKVLQELSKLVRL